MVDGFNLKSSQTFSLSNVDMKEGVKYRGKEKFSIPVDKSVNRGGANEEVTHNKRRSFQIIPISTSVIIGVFSILEIIESLNESVDRAFGHAHGILILACIRLLRSFAILQTQVEEFEEAVEKAGLIEFEERSFMSKIAHFLVSPIVTITACVLASVASIIGVVDDFKPGAHHGAAFLALSELNYQVKRLLKLKSKNKGETKSVNKLFRFRSYFSKIPFGMIIALCAAGFAAIEIKENLSSFGAHHGVAILAMAELVENLNRSNFYRKVPVLKSA